MGIPTEGCVIRMKLLFNAICREPFRLFFPLGILMGVVGVSPWLFYFLGWSKTYTGFFHSSMQVLVYMNCFITGFLTTALPRFTGTAHAKGREILIFLILLLGIMSFLNAGAWVWAEACYIIWLVSLTWFAFKRVSRMEKSTMPGEPPKELLWIPVAVIHGLTGTLLLILGQLKILPVFAISVGKPMMEQGFLLCVVVGVGGFLIPRIMGTYAPSRPPPGHDGEACSVEKASWHSRDKTMPLYLLCAISLFLSFWLGGLGYVRAAYGVRALVITTVFGWARVLPKIRLSSDLHVWLAWISAWMVTLGFWMTAFFPQYRVVMLHLAFIGGFSLLTFAIASMVILSHAGAGEKLQRPLWILWVVLAGIALTLMKRIVLIWFPDAYFRFLGWASISWMAAGLCWLGYMLPYVLKVPNADAFDQMHEQAKRKLKR